MLRRLCALFPDIAVASLLLFPVFYIFNRFLFRNNWKASAYYALAVYYCAVFTVVGLPDICYFRFHLNMNLQPFAYMFSDLESTFLNVLLFVPLGFSLPILWLKFRNFFLTVGFGLLSSLLIEIFQIFTYRASDVNDLITNTFGTLIGWTMAEICLQYRSIPVSEQQTHNLWIITVTALGTMFFVHPLFSKLIGL